MQKLTSAPFRLLLRSPLWPLRDVSVSTARQLGCKGGKEGEDGGAVPVGRCCKRGSLSDGDGGLVIGAARCWARR